MFRVKSVPQINQIYPKFPYKNEILSQSGVRLNASKRPPCPPLSECVPILHRFCLIFKGKITIEQLDTEIGIFLEPRECRNSY